MGARIESALASLRANASEKVLEDLGPRYGIVAPKAMGTPMAKIQLVAKQFGRDHELALALWETGWYEARTLAAFVDEPAKVTPEQMDRWRADFDNWAIVDSLCFHLFDRTAHAQRKVVEWADLEDEFGRRAAFALLASVALHRRELPNDWFLRQLELIERAATDPRNFVKKGVSWALRAIGSRGPAVREAARTLATELAASSDRTARWVGKDALKKLG